MKAWLLPWLTPLGMLLAVGFAVVFNQAAPLAALAAGLLLVPVLSRLRFGGVDDPETDYWRIRRP